VRLETNRPWSSWKDKEGASGAAFESNLIS
jgi:hypothetical protein